MTELQTETPTEPPRRSPLPVWMPVLLGILVIFALFAWLVLPRLRPYQFTGTVIQSEMPSTEFTLTSANGPVSLSDYRGKLVLLYFGYTFCPDVCPTTLADVNRALDQLGNKADDVQLIMVSVDPARDTPEKLAEYVEFFNPTFVGVTGSDEEVRRVATLYNVWFEAHEEEDSASGYLVDHTATLNVIDEEGHLKLLIGYGTGADAIAADLDYMLR
jgi:protein SCO1/2